MRCIGKREKREVVCQLKSSAAGMGSVQMKPLLPRVPPILGPVNRKLRPEDDIEPKTRIDHVERAAACVWHWQCDLRPRISVCQVERLRCVVSVEGTEQQVPVLQPRDKKAILQRQRREGDKVPARSGILGSKHAG